MFVIYYYHYHALLILACIIFDSMANYRGIFRMQFSEVLRNRKWEKIWAKSTSYHGIRKDLCIHIYKCNILFARNFVLRSPVVLTPRLRTGLVVVGGRDANGQKLHTRAHGVRVCMCVCTGAVFAGSQSTIFFSLLLFPSTRPPRDAPDAGW